MASEEVAAAQARAEKKKRTVGRGQPPPQQPAAQLTQAEKQLGLVPIQVHLDDGAGGGGGGDDDHQSKCVCRSDADEDEEEAWVPYELSAFRKVGFTTSLSELQPLLRGLFSACGGEAQPAVVHHSASPSEDEKIKEAPAEASLALSRAGAERLETKPLGQRTRKMIIVQIHLGNGN